jgi:flagellar FliL protein
MSAAAAAAETAEVSTPAPKGKKKLIVIIAAAVLVLAVGGGGAAFFLMKKKAAHAAEMVEGEDGEEVAAVAEEEHKKNDKKHPPIFIPLDAFVVNLADKDSERYAQVGVTLEVHDPKIAEEIKLYMPAIRNGILMVLAHKTSAELLERAGKEALANEIMREAVVPLGDGDEPENKDAKKSKKPMVDGPVKHVHFSNFIIQ